MHVHRSPATSWFTRLARPGALALALGVLVLTGASAAQAATGSTTTTATAAPVSLKAIAGPFGSYLVVGNGQFAGYTVYMLTSDHAPTFGCGTATVQLPPGPIACTGPLGSQMAEWPALTTTGTPVAGKGVKASLLGSVTRSDLNADQVTYDGHPLYLFDQSSFNITGEDFDEPGLPPWHGIWYLVSPTGSPLPWAGELTTATVGGKSVVVTPMQTLAGWIDFPVYQSSSAKCTGACATNWAPVLTSGSPGVSSTVRASAVGTTALAGGLKQVTYQGHPLYLYADETPSVAGGQFRTVGNGNGKKSGKSTFRLVRP